MIHNILKFHKIICSGATISRARVNKRFPEAICEDKVTPTTSPTPHGVSAGLTNQNVRLDVIKRSAPRLGHDVWLFSILLSAFTATSCILRLRISNPMEQNVEHESATQQTKRNKDGQRHGMNYRQNLIPKRFRPMNQTLPKHLWRSPV